MKPLLSSCLLLVAPVSLIAQAADSARRLPDIPVTVTRTATPLSRLGAAVTLLDSTMLHRNRLAPTLDDALAFVPGLVVGNRWNYSLDQRLSLRGFGARANFGWRGVKVLIDGIPQTLPDGQSQLTHLDLAQVDHIEILRGAASAEYGNASGGVIAFTTAGLAQGNSMTAGAELGSFNTSRVQFSGSARLGATHGSLSLMRFATDGSRQHGGAEQQRANAALQWGIGRSGAVALRAAWADDPLADNPGALTLTEVAANRDSAAANNIRRNAGKSVNQSQLSVNYQGAIGCMAVEAALWRVVRTLDNPLAAPPPPPAGPTEGTWVGIDRHAGGARITSSCRNGATTVTFGADLQRMQDERINKRSLGGVPTDAILLNQREEVTEVGPFLHAEWRATPRLTIGSGARWDAVRFAVEDHLFPVNGGSGTRQMAAMSGSVRLSYALAGPITLWSAIATAFETPTTTELANQPSGATGLNPALDPQRSMTGEVGLRSRALSFAWEIAGWWTTTRNAIVPAQDQGGRSYYQNAGSSRTTGIEATLRWQPTARWQFQATGTLTHARFVEYYSVLDHATLDGDQLAGLPERSGRLGVAGVLGHGFIVDLDQTLRSGMFADDRNQLAVAGLGIGVTGARLSWSGARSDSHLTLFAAGLNLFDKAFIGSVTINGTAGRSLEPAARRTFTLGAQLSR